jgi:general stress protein 26
VLIVDDGVKVLDYNRCIEEKSRFLGDNRHMVLATSLNDTVTARTIDYVSSGLDIIFLSWGHHMKIIQINGNPKVGLCRDNVQIEGVAKVLGNPFDEKKYSILYRDKLPILFDNFADVPGMTFVKFTPTSFKTFISGKNRRLEYIDLSLKKAFWKELEDKNAQET